VGGLPDVKSMARGRYDVRTESVVSYFTRGGCPAKQTRASAYRIERVPDRSASGAERASINSACGDAVES